MFSVYLFFAIVGGALMFLSLFQLDVDGDGIADLDFRTDIDTDTLGFGSALPFLSLRFWFFGGGMFGITGLILTLTGRPFLTTLIGALLTGITTGWIISATLRHLKRRTPNSLVTPDDLIGCTGTVELPFDRTQPGKVRLTLKGQQVEYPARTPNPTPLELGEPIIVVDVHAQWVEVIPQALDKPETKLLD